MAALSGTLVLVQLLVGHSLLAQSPDPPPKAEKFEEVFRLRPEGLVTNEFAKFKPQHSDAHPDPKRNWIVVSGSLFVRDGKGWTGKIDKRRSNAHSSYSTNSGIFRCITQRSDFQNAEITFDLRTVAILADPALKPQTYDGVHVFVRYLSAQELYAVTVNRKDNVVLLKKKTPGGPANGGTYTTLGQAKFEVPISPEGKEERWQRVQIVVKDEPANAVRVRLSIDDKLMLDIKDDGSKAGPALTRPGKVGLRGDNTEFYFDNFTVQPVQAHP